MTTIVWAKGVLASDSQMTLGDAINPNPIQKLYTPEEGKRWSIYGKRILAIGIAGDLAGLAELKIHLEKGIDFETKGKWSAWTDCIAIADDNTIFYVDGRGDKANTQFTNLPGETLFSIGSGSSIANAYLAIGKKAEDVLKLCIKLDPWTGGEIQTWTFPEVVPADIKPVEQTQTQKDLIEKVNKNLDSILKSAIKHASDEIVKQTA